MSIDKENVPQNSQRSLQIRDKNSKSVGVGSRVYNQPSIDEKMSELLQYIKSSNINLQENPSYNKMVSCYNELVSCLTKEGVITKNLMTNFSVFPTGGKRMTKRRKQKKGKNMRKSRRY